MKINSETGLFCPITGKPLLYVGYETDVMDADSWYSPEDDDTIIYARHPFSWKLFRLVDSKSMHSKELRYFRLNDDNSWTEMKEAPHTNSVFPIDDFSPEWEAACQEGLENLRKRKEREAYWEKHPNEDPRIKSQLVSTELIEVKPMSAPTGILFYFDYKYNETDDEKVADTN
jgi:hypothetical protein